MYLLDSDHLTVLERHSAEYGHLQQRLQAVPPDQVAATVVSYEEQTRGWLSFMAKARSLEEQVIAYKYLQQHLQVFCVVPLLAFDSSAAAIARQLQQQRIRIGMMDLKIASIALAQDAIPLSRNCWTFKRCRDCALKIGRRRKCFDRSTTRTGLFPRIQIVARLA